MVARWNTIDPLAESYEAVSPYVYAVNDPVNAIDPDGNLIIFINGFEKGHWLAGDNRKTIANYHRGEVIPNPNYRPYPGSRNFTRRYPQYLGKAFDYWGKVDNLVMDRFKDNEALYLNGSSDNTSKASDRYAEGEKAANALIAQLNSGKVALKAGETIKIVGHSQGGAFAAGMASVLSKNKRYQSILEMVIYLEPHQPADFSHPEKVFGVQISSGKDIVASIWNFLAFVKGRTSFAEIQGITHFMTNDTHKLIELGGHAIGSNIDELLDLLRPPLTPVLPPKNDTGCGCLPQY